MSVLGSVGSAVGVTQAIKKIGGTKIKRETEFAISSLGLQKSDLSNEGAISKENRDSRLSIIKNTAEQIKVAKDLEEKEKRKKKTILIIGGSLLILVAVILIKKK